METYVIKLLAEVLMLGLLLTGCGSISGGDDGAFQMLADNSEAAKEYAQTLFDEHMKKSSQEDYNIQHTAWGFSTTDIEDDVYMAAFRYTANETSGIYGYKIIVDENGNCSVQSEGVEIAEFLLGAEDRGAE